MPDTLPPDYDYAGSRKSALLARFWGNSLLYALTGLLTRLGTFILLPVYWRYLAPEDFGALAVAELLSVSLLAVLTFCLEAAVTRFYHEWTDEERPRRLGAIWIASLVSAVLLSVGTYALGAVVWSSLIRQVPFRPLIELAILAALLRSMSTIPFAVLRIREQLQRYALMNVVVFAFNAAAGIYLVAVAGWGARGVLIGTIAGYGATALLWIVFMLRQTSLRFTGADLRPSLAYSAPLVPASLVASLAGLCDRFFLERFATVAQLGIYAVAARFGQVVKEGNQALKNSWIPFATRIAISRADAPAAIGRLAKFYVAGLITAALGVALLGREFVLLFASERYAPVVAFIPVLAFAAVFDAVDVIAGVGLTIRKSTRTVLTLTLVEAALTLSAVGLLSWKYGAHGAMWGVLAGRGTASLTKLFVSGRHYPVPYEFGRWLGIASLALAAFAAGLAVQSLSPWAAAGIKAGILAAYGVLIAVLFLELRRGVQLIREARSTPAPSTPANPPA